MESHDTDTAYCEHLYDIFKLHLSIKQFSVPMVILNILEIPSNTIQKYKYMQLVIKEVIRA